MTPAAAIALLALLSTLLIMIGEAVLSAHNERVLRERGAIEPAGDVYQVMRYAYPASFVAMAIEGALTGPAPREVLLVGLLVFGYAKALKIWAISALGVRWTYRVLVVPGAALVSHGPYAFIRHPNYVAVVGELAGMAMIVWSPGSGTLAVIGFGALMLRRIAIEDRALGRQ
jgi:methyltransferase